MTERRPKHAASHGAAVSGPYVVLDVEIIRGAFILVLENIGDTPAYTPQVKFSRKLVGSGGELVVSDLAIWTQLGLLRPGRRIDVFLDAAALVFRRKGSRRFRASVSYKDDDGQAHQRKYDHDLDAYRTLPQIEP